MPKLRCFSKYIIFVVIFAATILVGFIRGDLNNLRLNPFHQFICLALHGSCNGPSDVAGDERVSWHYKERMVFVNT